MRRMRLPSDSPSMVTRPGVNRISIALWVTSIQDGMRLGKAVGEYQRRAASLFLGEHVLDLLAAASFHGGGLVLT